MRTRSIRATVILVIGFSIVGCARSSEKAGIARTDPADGSASTETDIPMSTINQTSTAPAASTAKDRYMQHFSGKEKPPAELLAAYAVFVDGMQKAERPQIERIMLPYAIRIYTNRDSASTLVAVDIIFPVRDFSPDILSARRDSADVWLIRTSSCATRWVKTETTGWKLYSYLQKPIE